MSIKHNTYAIYEQRNEIELITASQVLITDVLAMKYIYTTFRFLLAVGSIFENLMPFPP